MNKIHLKKQFETKINHFKLEVDFSFDNGQIVGLFGPSGSGKTTTLRLIAGLMKPDDGKVHIHDELWYDKTTSLDIKVQKRSLGYMFQESALFPNMTVLQNLEFALKSKEDLDIIYEVVEVMSLDSLLPLKPNALSGGQKQRVALARAIVRKPNILLLDEPFSSMDQKLKYDLLDYLLEVHSRYRPSIIVVSHDQKEIEKLCDIVYIIDKGAIVNSGKPEYVFDTKVTKIETIIVEKKSENNSYVLVVKYKGADIDINVAEEVFNNKEVGDSVEVILGVS